MNTGKFIVFYGINNLGKSTQAHVLVETLQKQGFQAQYLKYALYDIEPSGPLINAYLRQGNPYQLSPREMQILQALNRTQYDEKLKELLHSGIHIIAEDYRATSIAWGVGAGVDQSFLEYLNTHLQPEDLVFHFYGKRFSDGIEKNHKHEQDNDLTQKVADVFSELSAQHHWINIQANQDMKTISKIILEKTLEILH